MSIHEITALAPGSGIDEAATRTCLFAALDALGPRHKVLAVPPDGSRNRARAGLMLKLLLEYYGPALTDIMPALGTHFAMTSHELAEHFPGIPTNLFRVHDWRNDLATLGHVPSSVVHQLSEGKLDFDWPAQVNRLLVDGGHDLIISIGQVVPHEVVGMANHAKNIFVGTGGSQGIHRSHFLGAVYGLERIMGRADTPVRALFDYASREFAQHLPLLYVQTVVGPDSRPGSREDCLRGLFVGMGREPFEKAARLAAELNINLLDRPIKKAVVYVQPGEFRSTWLANKAIYRTRMAMADAGELLILAPGVAMFGEDPDIDRLIRKWGYHGTPTTLAAVKTDPELAENLSAAAHLIHGSSEGRFTIRYCAGGLSRQEIENAGFAWGDLQSQLARYPIDRLETGWNTLPDGEEIFFVPNPAAGLWALRQKFLADSGQ